MVRAEKIKFNELFPGKGLREVVSNELREMFGTGEHRKEFFVMVAYSIVLVLLSFLAIRVEHLAPNEGGKIFWLFALMGGYFIVDDMFRRKKIFPQPFLFAVDAVFYNLMILTIVIIAGGYDSPIRFFIFFLTALSSPIYGTTRQMTVFMVLVSMVQITLCFGYHGFNHHLILSLMDGVALLAAAIIIKVSVLMYEKKAKDYQILNAEQEVLYKEASEYNARLEETVAAKTMDLKAMLDLAQKEKNNSEKQRLATMNILEDMAEAQDNLKQSKKSLEIKQAELEAIAGLSNKLNSAITIEDAIDVTNAYLNKFIDFNAATFLLLNIDNKGGFLARSLINRPVTDKLLNVSKQEIAKYLLNYKVIGGSDFARLAEATTTIIGEELIMNDDQGAYASFILPFQTGDRIFGAVHVASRNPGFYKDKDKREIVGAIISTASVSLFGLEQLLKSQQSKTESLVHSLSNGIIMMDKFQDVVLVNPAAEKFTGIDAYGAGINKFIAGVKDYNLKEMIEKAVMDGADSMIKEVKINNRHLEIYINAVKDFNGDIMGAALIVHDITQLKIIDQMKSEFVSFASHQLRTPLTAVRLFIEMLLRGDVGALQPQQKEYLSNVYESADRMVRLVNDLLNITRIESNRMQISPEPTQLEGLIGSVVEEAQPLAAMKKCSLSFSAPKIKTPLVPVDKSLFRQIIHNLVTNAIKYSNPNGKAVAKLELDKDGNYILSVRDDGIGIPEKFKDKIFQKFSRADNAIKTETEGTGLGLYVSQKIVETFRGKIWFEPNQDRGTTFFVLLPSAGMKEKKGERGLVIS